MPIARMTNMIAKMIMLIDVPELDLANRKPQSIANVIRGLRAGLGAMAQHDPHESNRTWALGEPNEFFTAMGIIDISMRKRLPVVIVIRVQMHWIVARPVFHFVLLGIRRAPMNPDGVYRLARTEIDHHPLRMRVLRFAGEMRIEIRIAFPK